MPVFRWGTFNDTFRDLDLEVDRLLEGVNLTVHGLRLARRYPLLNLYELDDCYLLTAEIPGTRADDIEITVAGGILSLKGNRDIPDTAPEDSYRRCERFRGKWQRSVSLPERVDEEKMQADFSNGILKITLQKSTNEKARHIRVVEDA
jgi:HSP20 family protein